ncbi:MAG: rhodanese-like domain-containing protein, partial [Bacteroidia bacterium]|nr:rhodanese-like domain-containing protein [Bacteroidia bacterium]MDW8236672.1 rhodanese-like domain-containing protein [Bacteroidia bacterium]
MRTYVAIVSLGLISLGYAQRATGAASKAQEQVQVLNEPLNLSPAEAFKRWKAESGKIVILDVRTPDEYKSGHIKGAQNLDFYSDFEKAIEKLPKDKVYFLHCASGRRSGSATEIMRKKG